MLKQASYINKHMQTLTDITTRLNIHFPNHIKVYEKKYIIKVTLENLFPEIITWMNTRLHFKNYNIRPTVYFGVFLEDGVVNEALITLDFAFSNVSRLHFTLDIHNKVQDRQHLLNIKFLYPNEQVK